MKALFHKVSAFIPGLGQALRGRRLRGLVFFLATIPPLAVAALFYCMHMYQPAIVAFGPIDEHLRRLGSIRLRYVLATVPSLTVWIASVVDCWFADRGGTATESRVMGILHD